VAGDVTIYPVGESTVFRFEDGSGAITTRFDFTWFADTAQIQQQTTTLPVVPTNQNGTGATDTVTDIFDMHGNLIWQRDALGFITRRTYDLPTGAILQEIRDVDGSLVTLPSGWSTPPGGGLHLTTDFEHDPLGRTTQTLGPEHDVFGQAVRTANWTIYRDLEDETYSAQGYATGLPGSYDYTLINPISIQRMSADGRSRDSIVAVWGENGDVETPGRLTPADTFPQSSWVRWSRILSNDQGQVTASRVYHLIPASGEGTVGTNYDETTFGYDLMGRQNKSVTPAGTISRTVFDVRGLAVSSWIGTNDNGATDSDPTGGGATGNNMVQVTASEYDGGSAGGSGNLTEQTQFVDASATRVTIFEYDFRNRQVVIDGEIDFYQVSEYDNLNQVVRVDRRNTTSSGNLIARSETKFDNRGRVYQSIRYAVDPATGTVGNSLVDNTFYDANGNVVEIRPAGSEAFTRSTFDGVGRPVGGSLGYSDSASSSSSSSSSGTAAGDVIFEQSETVYDDASNVIFTTTRQRYHDAYGVGPLQGPSGFQPKSRDSYTAMWHDAIGRTISTANYGTNDDAGPPALPSSPPVSSNTVLVNETRYNVRGEAFETVDPAGMVNRTESDDAGRTVRAIQNYDAGSPASADTNVTTEMQYGPGGLLTALIAKNASTGDQTTTYQFGVTLANSDLASNDLLRAEIYPDAADSADRITYAYNRAGQRKAMTDQNGTVHQYDFDLLGRQTDDRVTTLASGVDGAVRRIGHTFDVRSLVEKIARGRLTNSNQTITSPTLQQGWDLDETGNWDNFTNDDYVDPGQTLDQQRTHNVVNEITNIARTVGPNWATPEYDRNGNMTVIPQPKDMEKTLQGTWDAWSRLVRLEEPDGSSGWQTLAEYQYDGQTWRTVAKLYVSGALDDTRHIFFTSRWQDIEERLGLTPESAYADRQFAWGSRYVDDLILRDRATGINGAIDERRYAVQDANWNVVGITGSAVQRRFVYSAYGECIELNDAYTISTDAMEWERRYASYRFDLHTGLYSVRYRFFESHLGRFLSRDPLGFVGTWNRYGYVSGRPLSGADPRGTLGLFFDGTFRKPSEKVSVIQQMHAAYKGDKEIFFTGIEFQGEGLMDPAQTFSAALKTVCDYVCKHVDIDWSNKAAKPKGTPEIDMFGWSWGAIIANTLAAHLKLRGCECTFSRTVTKTYGWCWLYWTRNYREEIGLRWKPVQIRFLGLIDPVSTRLDAVEATVITDNVQNAAIAYAGKRDRVGDLLFVADVLKPEDATATSLTTKKFPYIHQVIGWQPDVRDWLTDQARNAGAPL
jgi:RHS repeat-associated protein